MEATNCPGDRQLAEVGTSVEAKVQPVVVRPEKESVFPVKGC